MATQIQLRRGTSAEWAATNPVLAQGEVGIDLTLGEMRLGDGVTPWSGLTSIGAGGGGSSSLTAVAVTTNTAAGETVGELVGYLATSAITINGESVADGDWVVFCWDGTGWALVSTGTLGGSTPPPGDVTPLEPTFTDPSGTADDRYVIPETTGVAYSKGGSTIPAGTYTPTAGEAVTITAAPASGYTLASGATASWSHTFSTVVANTAPSMTLGAHTITGLQVSQPFTTSDVDGDPVTVTANWGDGQSGTVTSPASHTYATIGTYGATFTPHDGKTNGAVRTTIYALAAALPPVGNPATFADAVAAYGALGWWKLDETSGTTLADSSGNGRHLALAGTPGTDYSFAAKDGAIRFLTTSGYATLASSAGLGAIGQGITAFAMAHMLNISNLAGNLLRAGEWRWIGSFSNSSIAVLNQSGSTMLVGAQTATSNPVNQWIAIGGSLPSNLDGSGALWLNGTNVTSAQYHNPGTLLASTTLTLAGGFRWPVRNVCIFPGQLTDAHITKLTDLARAEGLIV